jgi:hypothetical protein
MGQRTLGERPLLTTPRHVRPGEVLEAERHRLERQPLLGIAGLLFVVPVTLLLAFGIGGAERSMLVIGPMLIFAMPVVFMTIFWWEDWPGSKLRPGWTGWIDTLLIVVAALGLTALGQVVVERFDVRGIIQPTAAIGHAPTFPATLPIAGAAFVAMIEITLVSERWPFARLGCLIGGVAALAASWGVAVGVYHAAHGFVSGGRLGAVLVLVGLWQVWFLLAWRGWPISRIGRRWQRLVAANTIILAGGIATYAAGRGMGATPLALNAFASCLIAAAVLVAVLFEGSPLPVGLVRWERLLFLVFLPLVAAVFYVGLRDYAERLHWGTAQPLRWVSHITLAFVAAILVHVAVHRRWPFAARAAVNPT